MTGDDYTFLGTIVKTRGTSGNLIIRSKKKIVQIKNNWESVMVEIDGLLVPFFISGWNISGSNEILVTLEDIDIPEKAEKFSGRKVYINKSVVVFSPNEFHPDEVNGYLVIDINAGEIGRITGIDEIPGNPLFRLIYHKREILIPIHQDLIIEINEKKKIVRVNLPAGFLGI
jgi:16S rRNA processing protein RimM